MREWICIISGNDIQQEEKAEDRAYVLRNPPSKSNNKVNLEVKSSDDNKNIAITTESTKSTTQNASNPHPSNPLPQVQDPGKSDKKYIVISTGNLLFIGKIFILV